MSLSVFFCYSRKDEMLRDEIESHLSILKHKKIVSSWHDRKIAAGEDWEGEIDRQLNTADIVVLLVSAAFMSSGYCYETEMKRALERHANGEAKVLPVILRSVDWRGAPFEHLQILPRDAKPVAQWQDRDEALLDVARGIRDACSDLLAMRRKRAGKGRVAARGGQSSGVSELAGESEAFGFLSLKSEQLEIKQGTLGTEIARLSDDILNLETNKLDEKSTAFKLLTRRSNQLTLKQGTLGKEIARITDDILKLEELYSALDKKYIAVEAELTRVKGVLGVKEKTVNRDRW